MIVTSVLVLVLMIAFISTIWPVSEERFFELSILGKDKTADYYYPNNNSTLEVGSQVSWHVNILNHMGSEQNVSLRIKLLNSTMELPDDQKHEPSPYSSFFELPLFLDVDEAQLIPFTWSLSEAISQNDSVIIQRLVLNDQVFDVYVPASDSLFSMVFELWVYDQASQEFTFAWGPEEDLSSISLNIAFKIILSTL